MTLFAKCHHGWSYYPTKVGKPHPHLARPDLLGDMVARAEAGRHRVRRSTSRCSGTNCTAREHPEWRVMSATNRSSTRCRRSVERQGCSPGWHTICLNHEGYRHVRARPGARGPAALRSAGPVLRHRADAGLRLRRRASRAWRRTGSTRKTRPTGSPTTRRSTSSSAARMTRRAAEGVSRRPHLLQLRPYP